LFYEFCLEDRAGGASAAQDQCRHRTGLCRPAPALGVVLQLNWPASIDPELMMRMLIIGYCHGIRSERRLCEEVALNPAYRWFCRLDPNAVPDHSSFSCE
jgi:hypothetical protein